jgi:hypothetical protein
MKTAYTIEPVHITTKVSTDLCWHIMVTESTCDVISGLLRSPAHDFAMTRKMRHIDISTPNSLEEGNQSC